MARHRGRTEAVPVIGRPAEMRQGRAAHQRRIRYPARHHDIRAIEQGGRDGLSAQIDIGAHQRGGPRQTGQADHGLGVLARQQVIAAHHGHARGAQFQFSRQAQDMPGGALWIGSAEVAHDGDALAQAQLQHRAQQKLEQGLVTGLRVLAAGQLGQGKGALGQRFQNQYPASFTPGQGAHHGQGRVQAIPRKTGPTSYPERRHHCLVMLLE